MKLCKLALANIWEGTREALVAPVLGATWEMGK